jgi:hypothetical protein
VYRLAAVELAECAALRNVMAIVSFILLQGMFYRHLKQQTVKMKAGQPECV